MRFDLTYKSLAKKLRVQKQQVKKAYHFPSPAAPNTDIEITFSVNNIRKLTWEWPLKSLSQSIRSQSLHGNAHRNNFPSPAAPRTDINMDIEITFAVLHLPELTSELTSKSFAHSIRSTKMTSNGHQHQCLS